MLGLKFRRQHSVAGFVLDFYCPSLKLALELDGAHHRQPDGRSSDLERSAILATLGIRVVRIQNVDLSDTTIRSLIETCVDPPLRPPSPRMRRGGQGVRETRGPGGEGNERARG
jgi:very-short-patch-repair endonuclease